MLFPRSDHCHDGKTFFTPGAPPLPTLRDIIRWQRTRQQTPWPKAVPLHEHDVVLPPLPKAGVSVTWINHATFLLRLGGKVLLTDPVFSRRVGPFGLFGPKRVHPPGVPMEGLPKVDTVLLSHDHYDHCDLPSLWQIFRRDEPRAFTPLGNAGLLRRAGFMKVSELDWWQEIAFDGGSVHLTPAQHWSNRLTGTRCGRLWGGFYLRLGGCSVFFSGDTGYHPRFFKDVQERLGPPDVALLPIGAYEPRWFMKGQHCNPAEAVQIHRDLGARTSVAMHWGTFCLTDEGREDPPRALALARKEAGLPDEAFVALTPGQTIALGQS